MFELWDTVGGSMLGIYQSESEALMWVGHYLQTEGPKYVQDLALDGPDETETGQRQPIAEGEELVRRARRHLSFV